MKTKNVPLRKCIACGENKSKKDLIRIVKNSDKDIIIDMTGKVNGRGAYICVNPTCLEQIKKNKKLSRTFQVEVSDNLYENLKDAIELKSKE